MFAMRFDYRDIFRSARLAFSLQRLWIQFLGLFCGYVGYVILTYFSLVVSGKNFSVLWSRFGLLPSVVGVHLTWYSWILYVLGGIFLLFSWMVTSTGVSRAAYMNLKGNTFYTWKEAFVFALKKKSGPVISTPIAISVIAFFTGLGGVIVGLLGRIPYVGELGISLFAIFWFIAALFLVFVILALGVSLLLTPAILASTDDDAFEGIFQSFSTLYSQPWRFILYEILLCIITIAGFGILAFFAKKAWALMTTIFVLGMGDKYIDISYTASYLLQSWIYPAVVWSRALLGEYSWMLFFKHEFISMDLPTVMNISSWIFAIFLVIIGGFVLSYPLAIFNVGNSLIFLVLKKKKDDENLLERRDREEMEEEEEGKEEIKEEEKEEKEKKSKTKENKTVKSDSDKDKKKSSKK